MCKGPIAIIECIQEIPCNPCEQACPLKAITVGTPITALPVLAENKCVGCGVCIAQCPGLAIFVVDCSQSGDNATIQIPYEYHPLPEIGEEVEGLDRKGAPVAKAVVEKIVTKAKTPVISLTVLKKYANTVRGIRLTRRSDQ